MSKTNRYSSAAELWRAANDGGLTLSYSGLKTLQSGDLVSFISYYTTEKEKATPTILQGQRLHQLILEPDDFHAQYEEAPADFKTEGTKQWLALEAEKNKTLIKPDAMDNLRKMEAALKASQNKVIQSLFSSTTAKEMEFNVRLEGWNFRGFFDAIGSAGLVDIKTTASLNGLYYQIKDMGYHLQAYIYIEAARILRPHLPPPEYHLVFITAAGAYRVVKLSADMIEAGRLLFEKTLATLNLWLLDENQARELMDTTIEI